MISANPILAEILDDLRRNGHAAHAIWVAAKLDDDLVSLIALVMPNISNRLKDKLFFRGTSPLSSFSAKIDVAYALGLITDTVRSDLHVIREIRNSFAHSSEPTSFDAEHMFRLLQKFSDYDSGMDRLYFYVRKLQLIRSAIEPDMKRLALAKAVTRRSSKKPTLETPQ